MSEWIVKYGHSEKTSSLQAELRQDTANYIFLRLYEGPPGVV